MNHRNLTKASPAGQHLHGFRGSHTSGFRTIEIRQISVTEQYNGGGLGTRFEAKDTKPKGFIP